MDPMPMGLDGVLMEAGFLPPSGDDRPLDALIRRIRAGDAEAFEDLMARTEARVLGVAWRILRDRDLARDAAQETYLRIHRSLAGFRLGEDFQAWMTRIALNVCFDLAKKRGPFPDRGADLEALAQPGPPAAEEAVLLAQRRALVRQALQTLTPAERSALVLRDLEGHSTEEVARTLGVRPATVRSQVASARSKLTAFCARFRSPGGAP